MDQEGLWGLIPVLLWLIARWLWNRFKERNENAEAMAPTKVPTGATPVPKFRRAYEPVEPSLWGSRIKRPPNVEKRPEVAPAEADWDENPPDPPWLEPEEPD